MTDVNFPAADTAAASTFSGQALRLPGWTSPGQDRLVERERLMGQARGTDAARQLQRCFPRWMKAFDHLAGARSSAWLATAGRPERPGHLGDRDEQAQAVLRRHGSPTSRPAADTGGGHALVDGQRIADDDAGIDWAR